MRPDPVRRSPRPCRSSSGTPTSRVSAASAADTADSVTVNRAAAARTEPVSATATYARSRAVVVTVTRRVEGMLDCRAQYLIVIAGLVATSWLQDHIQEDAP